MKQVGGKYIALLRGINVGGNNPVGMSKLRELCGEMGWCDVQTYIQSGNLVFTSTLAPRELEANLEKAIQREFGLSIAVVVRTAAEVRAYVADNPFPEATAKEAKFVMIALSKIPPSPDSVKTLNERATGGERIVQVRDALWIHFSAGVAKSKLSPGLLDRALGSPVTTRNWRTLVKLEEMARELTPVCPHLPPVKDC